MFLWNSTLHLPVGSTLPLSLAKSFLELVLLRLRGSAGRLCKERLQKLRRRLALFGFLFLRLSRLVADINQGFLPTQTINGCQEFLSTFVFLAMSHFNQPLSHANQSLGIQLLLRMLVRLQRSQKEVKNRGNRSHLQTALHLVVAVATHVLLQADQQLSILANVCMRRQDFTHGRLLFGLTFQELGQILSCLLPIVLRDEEVNGKVPSLGTLLDMHLGRMKSHENHLMGRQLSSQLLRVFQKSLILFVRRTDNRIVLVQEQQPRVDLLPTRDIAAGTRQLQVDGHPQEIRTDLMNTFFLHLLCP